MFSWVKGILSSNPEASYGRLISALSFIVFVLFYLLVAINPWHIITVMTYNSEIFRYLFYLILGGYSITAGKDLIINSFEKVFGKATPAPAPVAQESESAKPDQS